MNLLLPRLKAHTSQQKEEKVLTEHPPNQRESRKAL